MQKTKETKYGLARVLSKRGLCSRTQAIALIKQGHVCVEGKVIRDPEYPTSLGHSAVTIAGKPVEQQKSVYILLNKPRGIMVTREDEKNRETVYDLLDEKLQQWLFPVGRLDKASEGLLLMTNDTLWASGITDHSAIIKTYHVQIDQVLSAEMLDQLRCGVTLQDGSRLNVVRVNVLRQGEKNSWLEITLNEGRNRHIRRLCEHFDIHVLRLVRVAIGELPLGTLGKGEWRHLTDEEVKRLSVK